MNTDAWEMHRYGTGVEVELAPRPVYRGRAAIPKLLALAGTRLWVRPLWLMDENDLYPGEWALGHPNRISDVIAGRFWIASGDVKTLGRPLNGLSQEQAKEWLAEVSKPMQQWPGPNWQYGCRVCNNGAQVGALGYVCPRSDCPTRITCGGVV